MFSWSLVVAKTVATVYIRGYYTAISKWLTVANSLLVLCLAVQLRCQKENLMCRAYGMYDWLLPDLIAVPVQVVL